jgi:ParB-like chromosome segregation protein Spo0J
MRWLQQENCNPVRGQPTPDDPAFQQLCHAIAQGYDQTKAIEVVQQGSKWFVIDGHHRAEPARVAGLVEIPAVVVQQSISTDLNIE